MYDESNKKRKMSNSWRRKAWPIESDESEDEKSNKTKSSVKSKTKNDEKTKKNYYAKRTRLVILKSWGTMCTFMA